MEKEYQVQKTQAIFPLCLFLPFKIWQMLLLSTILTSKLPSGHHYDSWASKQLLGFLYLLHIQRKETLFLLQKVLLNVPNEHHLRHLEGSQECWRQKCRRPGVDCCCGRSKYRWWHQAPAASYQTDPEHRPLYEQNMIYFHTNSHSVI